VLFDWDGVLLDSLGASFNVYNRIFARIGTRRLTEEEFLELQSPNWYEFYVKVGVPKERWDEVDDDWVRLYKEERPSLHADALGCLTSLRGSGFRLALVSNGSKARVDEELGRLGVGRFFESVVCGERKEELKPSPVMINRTLSALGLGPREAVYVGDAPADVQASKNAGVASIALARGPIQIERLRAEGPDHVIKGLGELADYLVNSRP
jgi:HAD superfamily hydrolase (TIGR01509 family)